MQQIVSLLQKKAGQLSHGVSATWHCPKKLPKNPAAAPFDPQWPVLGKGVVPPKDAEGNLWYFGTLTFPEAIAGISLRGEMGRFFLSGLLPFTLWLDGEEIFKETHAWMATGPIAEPLPIPIEPGKTHRLTMRIEPIHIGPTAGLGHSIKPEICIHTALELEVAIFQLQFADALAETPAEKRLVERAAALIDTKALESNDWPKVLESIARMENALRPISPKARSYTMHLLGHSHIDMDWQWTWKDTVHCIRRDFKAVIDMMEDYPELTFTHSQIPTYEVVRKMDPAIFRKVRQRIAEGRWENAAGTWVEGDLNMADGESIARHFLYAADYTRQHLDSKARVLWEPDTFGHPANMPQLARLGEFDAYFHTRCNPGGEHDMWPIRKWTGVDGTSITAFSNWYGSNMEPRSLLRDLLWCKKSGRKTAFHVWGIGDHGGGLSRHRMDLLARFRNKPIMPRFEFSTIQKLLKAIEPERKILPENAGETFTIFEGCYTTTSRIKKYNRQCEGALLTAEALSAMAEIDRRSVIREAWQPVLFNQFHDIYDGCSIPAAYADAFRRAEKSLKSARQVVSESVRALVSPSKGKDSLTVLNPLGFARTEPITAPLPVGTRCLIDADGNVIPVQKKGKGFVFIASNVPPLSAKTYKILKAFPKKAEVPAIEVKPTNYGSSFDINPDPSSLGYYDVDTPRARIRLNRNSGAIGSYFDKRLSRDLVDYGVPRPVQHAPTARLDLALNVFQIIDEAPNGMSAWIINRIRKEENLVDGATVTLKETGPVFAWFTVEHRFRSSRIEEDILIYRDFPRIDFEAAIDWREKGSAEAGVPQLKVAFGASMSAARLRTEGPFVVQERKADGQEVPTQKWADLSGDEFGFTLLNDSKYGCDALGSRMRLTLLRNTYAPAPDSDNGAHTVRFAFEPHGADRGTGEMARSGMAFNRPCLSAPGKPRKAPDAPILSLRGAAGTSGPAGAYGADSVVCTAFRSAEHSEGVLMRLFETSGTPCTVELVPGSATKSFQEVNFLENPLTKEQPLKGGKAKLQFRGFEVKTILLR